ncbi:hypothetical protein EV701_11616 [Chthoniobacter flavus]|nr:hypothetical protein [Chthoniobacter flavus]TCO88645.1 hypothetical protein EV701_11616 [Chthoniobacter flavus]
MAFSSRSRACGAVLLVGLLVAGCEKKDPLAERKYQILLEENTRLAQAVAALQPGKTAEPAAHTEGYSPAAVTKITAENDHLRDILAGHEHQKALAENKALREPVEKQVTEIRGLQFKEPIDYQVLNRKQIKETMAGKLAEVFSEKEFHQMAEAMAAIGLLPPNYPLREKYIDLLSEQVAAFYDQHAHKLFMYEDATLENAQNRVVLAHELTHALQDQHFGLKRMPLEIKNDDDKAEAASALVEGDATLVMSEYMMKNMSKQMFKDSMVASFTQNMKQLETAPRYLREMLVFPYLRGQEFCSALYGRGGYEEIDKAYAHPPSSTAQILHPEKYLANPPEEPIVVEWHDLQVKGHAPTADNVVGEMGTRILFAEWVDAMTGETAAAGWRGDRYLYYADGEALVWKTIWASAKDATEFFEAEKQLLEKRFKPVNARRSERSYEADAPRVLRLHQTDANEVILIDTPHADWAETLGAFR